MLNGFKCAVYFKDSTIRTSIEKEEIWVSLWDVCSALKRPLMIKNGFAQQICPSNKKMKFANNDCKPMIGIPYQHVLYLLLEIEKDSALARGRCDAMRNLIKELPSKVERKIEEAGIKVIKNTNKETSNSKINVFTHNSFGVLRTVSVGNEKMFVAADVAKALGYQKPQSAISTHCKSGDALNYRVAYVPHDNGVGGTNMVLIGESNVYRLIMRSNLKDAERFQDWVTDEVLPTIRKTGGYIQVAQEDSEQDIMAKALLIANKTINEKNAMIEKQQLTIEDSRYKVDFYNNFIENRDYFKTSTISDELGISSFKLNRFLEERGVAHKDRFGHVVATPEYSELEIRVPFLFTNKQGKEYPATYHPRWTPEGRKFIIQLFKAI